MKQLFHLRALMWKTNESSAAAQLLTCGCIRGKTCDVWKWADDWSLALFHLLIVWLTSGQWVSWWRWSHGACSRQQGSSELTVFLCQVSLTSRFSRNEGHSLSTCIDAESWLNSDRFSIKLYQRINPINVPWFGFSQSYIKVKWVSLGLKLLFEGNKPWPQTETFLMLVRQNELMTKINVSLSPDSPRIFVVESSKARVWPWDQNKF